MISQRQVFLNHVAQTSETPMALEIAKAEGIYLYDKDVAQKIKSKLGLIDIIVILRNPVDRAYSQYLHFRRQMRESESFEKALELENERIKADMVESSTFNYLAIKYQVSSVPKVIINEEHELLGAQPITEFLNIIEKL